jgi:hypothetical protein
VYMLVRSIKTCAAAPWLLPLNRCYFEADRRAFEHIIREEAGCCLNFVHGSTDCVLVTSWEVPACIRVYNLESGDRTRVLHEKGRGEGRFNSHGK